MKFGSIVNSIHAMAASVRGGLLSVKAKYRRKAGKRAIIVHLSVDSVDTMQQLSVVLGDTGLTAGFRVFTAVLAGQKIDFVRNPPEVGDIIEITIGNIKEKWWVSSAGQSKCWGFLDGNQTIWIFSSDSEPR